MHNPATTTTPPPQPAPGGSAVVRLTARQHTVARLIGRGYSNGEIGRQLHVSEDTVKTHVRCIAKKMRITGQCGVRLRIALAVGFTSDDPALAAAPPPCRPLTVGERQILVLLGEGLPNSEIGRRLGLTASTVKTHLKRIGLAFGLPDGYRKRLLLVRLAIHHGLLPRHTAGHATVAVAGKGSAADSATPGTGTLSKANTHLVELLAEPYTVGDIRRVLGLSTADLHASLTRIRSALDLPATAGRAELVAAARAQDVIP